MNKTIIAILMVALMIVPMVVFAEAKGQEGFGGDQPTGTMNLSQDGDILKQNIRDCLHNESSDCSAIREIGKAFASGIIDKFCGNAKQKMEQMRTRTENALGLNDEEKDIFKDTIENEHKKLNEICEKFDKGKKDNESINETSKELKDLVKEMNLKTILAKEKIRERRFGLILERAEQLETKLDRIISRLRNDTNQTCANGIETLKEQFAQQISEARELYNDSKQIRENVLGKNYTGNFTQDLKEAQEKMHQAQEKLKEAHQTLKQITVKLRECAIDVPEEKPGHPSKQENETEDNETED